MSKYTPGPWMVAEKFNCADVRAVNGPYVASCNMSMAIDWREKEANARLIAAAPELLDALEIACNVVVRAGTAKLADGTYFDKDCSATMALAKINEAITKATGAQP